VGWEGWLTWLIPVLLVVGGYNVYGAVRGRGRFSSFAGGVTPVGELSEGAAMVCGKAVGLGTLRSSITDTPCVAYEFVVLEASEDPQTPIESVIDAGRGATEFHVRDGTGEVLVVPDGAEIVGARSYSGGAGGARSATEWVVPDGGDVTVLGRVAFEDGVPTIRDDRGFFRRRSRYLITVEDPARAQRDERRGSLRRLAVATGCLLGIVLIVAVTATPAAS
jgi:hypothetical protein